MAAKTNVLFSQMDEIKAYLLSRISIPHLSIIKHEYNIPEIMHFYGGINKGIKSPPRVAICLKSNQLLEILNMMATIEIQILEVSNCDFVWDLDWVAVLLPKSRVKRLRLNWQPNFLSKSYWTREELVQTGFRYLNLSKLFGPIKLTPTLCGVHINGSPCDVIEPMLKLPRLHAMLLVLRLAHECPRIGNGSAMQQLPRELCQVVASFLHK